MLLLISFLFFLSFLFFNDRLEQRDLGNYKTDLHQVFKDDRHAGVDVQSGIDSRIGQGTLPWQPILGAKSAEICDTRSFSRLAFHNGWQYGKADGRVNSAEVLSITTCKNLVHFGPLTPEFTVMVWRPFIRQMGEIGQTRSILGTRVRQWMAGTIDRICIKFTRKTCLVLRSDEFECQGQRSRSPGPKRAVHSQQPRGVDDMERRPRCR